MPKRELAAGREGNAIPFSILGRKSSVSEILGDKSAECTALGCIDRRLINYIVDLPIGKAWKSPPQQLSYKNQGRIDSPSHSSELETRL